MEALTMATTTANASAAAPPGGGADVVLDLEACLRRQTEAAHEGDAEDLARQAERALDLISALAGQGAATGLSREALLRYRDLATYNQLLLRYAFTRWAAGCLDRGRRAQGYNARGRITSPGADLDVTRGVGQNLGVL
jgi:hypothetical protein